MKYLMILTVGICLLLTSVPAMADQAADEAAIRKVVKETFATWNAKDLEAHMALIDENFVENDLEKGKAAHRKRLEKLFSSEGYTQVKLGEEIDFVFVTPDLAIYRTHGEDLEPAMKWISAWILSKKSGNWLLSADFWWPVEE